MRRTLAQARSAWLEHLLQKPAIVPAAAANRWLGISWTNAAKLRTDIADLRKSIEKSWAEILAGCVARKLVTAEAATDVRPAITFELIDCRENPSQRLPEVK